MSMMDMFRINEIKAKLKRITEELKSTKKERDTLNSIIEKNVDELKRVIEENNSLKGLLVDVEKMEYLELKKAVANLNIQKEKSKNDLQQFDEWFAKRKETANQQLIDINQQIETLKNQVVILNDEILLQSFGFYEQHYNLQNSEQYKLRLDEARAKQKWLIKTEKAVVFPGNVSLMGSLTDGEKFVKDFVKLILRSFNNECDTNIINVKFNNVKSIEKKIFNDYDALNRLGTRMNVSIAREYLNLKLDELYLCYEYQAKKQDEKEEQKRAREELREQQKLEQEIRQAREKITKEKKLYIRAINELELKLKEAPSDSDRTLILEKLEEVKGQYSELEKEEKVIDYREQNAKAGYVYIISNIGSLGENIYKIGMTRRLEPLDRIDELSDASVPFLFDVHALIFSENAPALEAKLHEHFYKNRVNKLNNRKEFFRADIHEIEKIVKENYDKIVDIVKDAPAEQYRESLLIE